MTFEEYEETVMAHSVMYPNHGSNFIYTALKLAGEAGEAADKIGKLWRNYDVMSWKDMLECRKISLDDTYKEREKIILELGDVLWYITALANELEISLGTVALLNIDKINDRVTRGVIKGEGDSR